MFYTFTEIREYEAEGQQQKEYIVDMFEDSAKTISLGQANYHILSSNSNYQQEFIDSMERPPIQPREAGYVEKRINEYPSIGDQLDALWKGGDAATEMLAIVQAVKNKYPKP